MSASAYPELAELKKVRRKLVRISKLTLLTFGSEAMSFELDTLKAALECIEEMILGIECSGEAESSDQRATG